MHELESKIDYLQVVCAIILNNDQKILACQRNSASDLSGKWEFPGGKVELGETHEMALSREILEELAVKIHPLEPQPSVFHHYNSTQLKLHLALHPFLCSLLDADIPQPMEHADIRWVSLDEAELLDWADADLFVLENLKNSLSQPHKNSQIT